MTGLVAGAKRISLETWSQGRTEVRWGPGQETSLPPPCSKLRFYGNKCTVLKIVLATLLGLFGAPIVIPLPANCYPLVTPLHY